ncbi:MAG: 1-deoxy-D-xylulose-5-phosphate reductoisomerase [Arenicella sp.]
MIQKSSVDNPQPSIGSEPAKQIVVLGATGSVGVSTLDVLARHPENYSVFALTANRNVERLLQQCIRHNPQIAVMVDEAAAQQLRAALSDQPQIATQVWSGDQALVELMELSEVDTVMVAIVGAIGLLPSLTAVEQGKTVLIANKEPLVMAGAIFTETAQRSGATILPIDSEHNAIFQCLPFPFQAKQEVERLILTASGGPFRDRIWSELQSVTPEQAIAHPNWSMGPKISIDSATMMNKGLELIEASHLFAMPERKIDVLIHPQSIIHSLVEYRDGSQLAQLGSPDMRIPIAHALAWPKRIESGAKRLNLAEVARLDFSQPDLEQIPCLVLARQSAAAGGITPAVLNAANEIAVDQFINKNISFTDIPVVIDKVLQAMPNEAVDTIEAIVEVDQRARVLANSFCKSCAPESLS